MIPSAQIENSPHVDHSMFLPNTLESLSRMVIQQHRSLLQYADLCWPWVDLQDSKERSILKNLAATQREGIRKLIRELDRRGWPVDYGQFPAEYADLNFVALDYLWPKIVQAEQSLLAKLCEVRQDVKQDSDAVRVIESCIDNQREILRTISEHDITETCDANKRKQRKGNLP